MSLRNRIRNLDMIRLNCLLARFPWFPANPKLAGKVILVRSLIKRECSPVCRYYISSAIFHTFWLLFCQSSRKIGAKILVARRVTSYRTSFGTFLSGRLPCGHRACPSRISYRLWLNCNDVVALIRENLCLFIIIHKLINLSNRAKCAIPRAELGVLRNNTTTQEKREWLS